MADGNSTKRGNRFKDLTGQTFGKWTVLAFHSVSSTKKTLWMCRCLCGKEKLVHAGHLSSGASRSCLSCANRESGWRHGMVGTPEYRSWHHMLDRCRNPKAKDYARWGGRGITVCERWESFENFFEDMGYRPSSVHSIDRIDNDGNYEPGNCRWATIQEQSRNTRTNRFLTVNDKTMCLVDWAKKIGIKRKTLTYRLDAGWPLEKALNTPARAIKRKS